MKTYLLNKRNSALLFAAALLTLTSCEDEVLRGQGGTVSRSRPVGTFNAISAGGQFEIYLTQGPAQDVLLEGQENVLTEINTQVRNNKLHIDFDKKRVKLSQPVKVYITTPQLTEIDIAGSNSVRSLTDWQVNDLEIEASGNSSIYMNVKNAQSIESDISGSVDMVLNGDAQYQEIDISGSGNIKAYGLTTRRADIEISGSGRCEVTVADKIDAKLSGSGQVRYKGSPTVNTKISGSGRVQQAD